MENTYKLVFDSVILKQFKKLGKQKPVREMLSKMLDKIEELGPLAGKIIDSKLALFEVKAKRPPIRLYYKIIEERKEAYVFEYEMKTSQERQDRTIEKIRLKMG